MNQHVLQGKWRWMRGSLKKQWGRLTDDDIQRIQGSMDQIAGIIQQRYGYTKERAENEIEKYLDAYNSQLQNYSERMKEYGERLHSYSDQIQSYNDEVQTKVRGAMAEASSKVISKPSKAEQIQKKAKRGWVAVVAGIALFAIVIYLFNQQENQQETNIG